MNLARDPRARLTNNLPHFVGCFPHIKGDLISLQWVSPFQPILDLISPPQTAAMLRISSCIIALLLASNVFAAPAVTPVASGSAAVASAAASASPAALSHASSASASAKSISSVASSATSFPAASATVAPINLALNEVLWNSSDSGPDPQPIRGTLGGTILGPTDVFIAKENADLLAPPTTDHGTV